MYTQFFSLKQPPFRITPDTRLFYSGAKRGAILDALVYAIMNGEGIIKVVGEVGSGKTMFCRMLEARLPRHIKIVYLANPSLSPENILQAIAYELQIDLDANANKLEAMQKLHNYLLQQYAENQQTVVFIEEAQGMPLATLEEIRLLSNLETEESKLLQLVMFGQPELDQNLATPSIRQLRERITHNFELEPLQANEILEYINFRMWVSGFQGAELFNKKVATKIAHYSKGLIRRINILTDKTLLAAYADGTRTITTKHVVVAARDSQFESKNIFSRKVKIFTSALLILLIGALAGIMGFSFFFEKSFKNEPVTSFFEKKDHNNLSGINNKKQEELILERSGQKQPQKIAEPAIPKQEEPKPNNRVTNKLTLAVERSNTWLISPDTGDYSIQLLTFDNISPSQFVTFINDTPNELLRDQLHFIYETNANDKAVLSVLYRDFSTTKMALKALDELPQKLNRWHPFVRSIKQTKKIAASGT